ncbi:MAG: stage II sporulation protein M [Methanosarcinaceae archaeon]|nr:stage II sporulation protein M [Methanosarcinaceae archaeon]
MNTMNEKIEKYRSDMSYLKSIRIHFLIVTLVFFLSTALGFIHSSTNPEFALQSLEEVSKLFDIIKDLSPIGIMLFIFFNNAIKSLFIIMLGIGFGILPLLFIAYNGYIIGVVVYAVSSENGIAFILSAILPHGIIELPMVFISAAIGLKIGYEMFHSITGHPADIRSEFSHGVKFFFYRIMPLLFVAAVVETFVTPFVVAAITGIGI